ncbi:MAG: hypothetical protein Kow002_06650 [Anaerolineales bacterium]
MEISVVQAQGQVPVSVLAIKGDLDAASYHDLIVEAQKLYDDGARNLLLDLSGLDFISSAGLAALHIISKMFKGEPTADEGAWGAFKSIDRERKSGMQASVKLLNPSDNVDSVLDTVGFKQFFEIFTDREAAIQSF